MILSKANCLLKTKELVFKNNLKPNIHMKTILKSLFFLPVIFSLINCTEIVEVEDKNDGENGKYKISD